MAAAFNLSTNQTLPFSKRMDLYICSRSDAPNILNIGKSSNTLARCAQLQAGHSFRIIIRAILENRGNCEKSVHKVLKQYRIGTTEWFTVDFDTALEVAETCEPMPRHVQYYDLEEIAQKN